MPSRVNLGLVGTMMIIRLSQPALRAAAWAWLSSAMRLPKLNCGCNCLHQVVFIFEAVFIFKVVFIFGSIFSLEVFFILKVIFIVELVSLSVLTFSWLKMHKRAVRTETGNYSGLGRVTLGRLVPIEVIRLAHFNCSCNCLLKMSLAKCKLGCVFSLFPCFQPSPTSLGPTGLSPTRPNLIRHE